MIVILLIATMFMQSCALDEYSHMSSPEVSSCTLEKSCIHVVFSAKMREGITEAAFSCSCDTTSESGTFVWENKEMYFFPMSGIKEKRVYEVEISTRAEDAYGNSLKQTFCCTFSTGGDSDEPFVQKMNIKEGEVLSDLLMPIQIEFSRPVEEALFYQKFSISPSVQGSISFKDGGRAVIFTPLEKLDWNTAYTMNILDKKVMFSTPEEPLAKMSRIQIKDGEFLEEHKVQHGVEKDAELVLFFSDTASSSTIKTPVEITPYQSYLASWNSSYTQCTITFDKPLPYKTLLELSTSDSRRFFLYVDGENSVMPEVRDIRFFQDFSTGESTSLEYGSGIVFESGNQACFEFELSVGKNAVLYPADVYSAVDIEVAMGNLVIAPEHLETIKQDDNTAIVRIFCSITAGTEQTPVIISVDSDLQDSEKNCLGHDYIIRINSL